MNKLLSICIPTFNREAYLDDLLRTVVEEVRRDNLAEFVEIIVSDNASKDGTATIVAKYADLVRYTRNDENIGPDANFLKLFGEASGDYIWLPGDDDKVRPDCIGYILASIRHYRFDYLYLKTQGDVIDSSDRGARAVENSELLMTVNIFTTFMTSQVIRSELLKINLQSARKFLGGYMAYYWLFLEALFASRICLISDQREVYPNEDENTGGYRFYSVWANSVFDVLSASSFGQRLDIFSYYKNRMFFTILLPITYRMRAGSQGFRFQAEDPGISMSKYFGSFFHKYFFWAYMKLPIPLLGPVRFVARVTGRLVKNARRSVV